GNCNQSGGTVTCNFDGLPNNSSAGVTLVVTPTAAGSLTTTATVSGDIPSTPQLSSNNTVTATATSEFTSLNLPVVVSPPVTLPPAKVGVFYTQPIPIARGSCSTVIVISGSPPAGLTPSCGGSAGSFTFNAVTSGGAIASGSLVLSGTPTQAGSSIFTAL